MKKALKVVLIIIIVLIILLTIAFLIDSYKMKNGEKVIFSTWGYRYAPPIKDVIFEFEVTESDTNKKKSIMTENLKEKYSYNIYYYGLDSVTIKYDNILIDLIDVLEQDKITMDEIIRRSDKHAKENQGFASMYKDGGTKEYIYNNFTLIKMNNLDGDRDVYLVRKRLTLKDLK